MGLFSKGIKQFLIYLLQGYRYLISPILGIGSACRFSPSCSEYALLSIKQLPLSRALLLIGWRLLRCNPFCAGGYDPVALKTDPRTF